MAVIKKVSRRPAPAKPKAKPATKAMPESVAQAVAVGGRPPETIDEFRAALKDQCQRADGYMRRTWKAEEETVRLRVTIDALSAALVTAKRQVGEEELPF